MHITSLCQYTFFSQLDELIYFQHTYTRRERERERNRLSWYPTIHIRTQTIERIYT
jgi:hypothetical protein